MSNLFYEKQKKWYIYLYLPLMLLIFIFYFYKEKFKLKINGNTMKKEANIKNNKEEPSWDLSDLYNGIKDRELENDLQNLNKKIDAFTSKYSGKIKKLSGYELYKLLVEYEKISEKMGKIASFAYLKYAENLSVEENVAFFQKISEELTSLSSKMIFVNVEINELSDKDINKKLNDSSNLKNNYGTYIENLRVFKKHQLSNDLEKLMNDKSITSRDAWSRLFDETIDNMKFKFEGRELNEAQITEIINSKNSNKRVKAGKVFGEKLGENIKIFAYITNILAKDKSISDQWRKYETPISARNLSNYIEDDVVENLYNSIQRNYKDISHRYYKLKAKMLKKDKLLYTDRNAPTEYDDDRKYTWKEAVEIVLNAYSAFSPKMAEIGKEFFENNWIDVPTRQGKRGGAFAHPTVPSVHPYILLNFQGKTRDIMTLAHELGHGIHMYLARSNGYFMSDTPLTLAETASIFGEQLVFRYLLDNEKDINKKIAIIANKIEDMINSIIRQIAFLEFEKTVHEERKFGEISVDRLNEIWLNVQKKSLGDIFEFSDEYKYYWSYIPHFIHSPFYVYSYAFGNCLVNSLYVRYTEDLDDFENKYIDLLSAGGSKNYVDLLEPFNLDPRDEDFWQNGLDLVISLIDELEMLLKKKEEE